MVSRSCELKLMSCQYFEINSSCTSLKLIPKYGRTVHETVSTFRFASFFSVTPSTFFLIVWRTPCCTWIRGWVKYGNPVFSSAGFPLRCLFHSLYFVSILWHHFFSNSTWSLRTSTHSQFREEKWILCESISIDYLHFHQRISLNMIWA